MKPKLVVSCASGLKNSGDEVLLQALLNVLEKKDCEVTVLSFNPSYTEKIHNVKSISHSFRHRSEYIRAIKNCDIFIMGGGGLLQDETTIFNVWFWVSKLRIALKYKKFTYVYANSIGPIHNTINKKIVKNTLSKVNVITLRDSLSSALLKKLGFNGKAYITMDPVFGLNSFNVSKSPEYVLADKYKLDSDYVFVSVRHWFDMHPLIPVRYRSKYNIRSKIDKKKYKFFIENLAKTVEKINNELKYRVVFYSFCHVRDTNVANDILRHVNSQVNNIIIDEPNCDPLEVLEIIKRSKFVLGMRLHSIIYSMICNVPFISIMYSDKVNGLLQRLQMTEYGIDLNYINYQKIMDKAHNILNNYNEIKTVVSKKVEFAFSEEKKNQELLIDMINHLNK